MSPLTKPTTTIDDLPTEMINELFKHLPPKDLAACSLVNRHWNSIYTGFKVHRMAAISNYFNNFTYGLCKWHNSNQPILETEQCHSAMFDRLVDKPQLSNLKYLALCKSSFGFDLNKLNRFQQLVHLEIKVANLNAELCLSLPRLKVLAFHRFNWFHSLSIDCPLLNTLFYCGEPENTVWLKVKQPETIRKLTTDMVGRKLIPFKNVECLVSYNLTTVITAKLPPRLRELHFNQSIEYAFGSEPRRGLEAVDRLKRKLNELLDEAKLRDSNFQFRFSGFQLAKVNVDHIDLGQTDAERVCSEYVYMKNYHLLEPGALDFVSSVDYTFLLRHVTGEFPRCFSQKFTGIESVYASAKVPDADHFLWFLKSLKFLRQLTLSSTKLTQDFYDRLPAFTHFLVDLYLRSGHYEDRLELNFDFIDKLSGLSRLDIDPTQSLKSLPSLVRFLGRMEGGYFFVRCRKKRFRIRKREDTAEWMIEKMQNSGVLGFTQTKISGPNEIFNFFEGLQTPKTSSAE